MPVMPPYVGVMSQRVLKSLILYTYTVLEYSACDE
jgi:hypothetical protein